MKTYIYQNHKIKKKLGQNFLHNQNTVNKIIDYICPKKNENMIEIGPGLGVLTKLVVHKIYSLTAIELDKQLVYQLQKNFKNQKNIKIIQNNIILVNINNLISNKQQNVRIFGSLPYNIATPILFHLFKYLNNIQDIHLILQKEIADRLIATPNNKKYGRLSIITQYFCKIQHILEIPPDHFRPIPKVNSTLIKLTPQKTKLYAVNPQNLFVIVKTAFNQRRKTIKNSLNNLFDVKTIIQHNINPKSRAENLSIEEYCRLANILK